MDFDTHLSRAARAMHASAIRRAGDIGQSSPDLISLAPGYPDPALFAWDDIREIAASILSGSDGTVLQYGATRGYKPLLDALPELLSHREIRATPGEVIVTTGSQQALDLCARVFLDAGDAAIVELPAYTGAMTSFWNAQSHLVGVQQDAEGINIADLDRVVARERAAGRRVAFVYVVPNFQNPTGLLMTLPRRAQLLEWAASRDVLIVEDDPYGALYFDDVATARETRPIKADDRDGRVVYLSSFSKTVAPGFRVAWIVASAPIIAKLEIAKQSADLCSGSLDQRFIHEVLTRGILESRVPMLRQRYQAKRTVLEQALRKELGDLVSWPEPKGGFFLWARFPAGIDTDTLLTRAVRQGIVFVPGSAFYVEPRDTDRARLSFSAPTLQQIETAVVRLAAAVRAELEASAARGPGSPASPPSAAETSGTSEESTPSSDSATARSAKPSARHRA
jgi:2-aminoadipate transaminase